MDFEILQVKQRDMVFSKGETVIHNDGSYVAKIVGFLIEDSAMTPQEVFFYDENDYERLRDLRNFRKIVNGDIIDLKYE